MGVGVKSTLLGIVRLRLVHLSVATVVALAIQAVSFMLSCLRCESYSLLSRWELAGVLAINLLGVLLWFQIIGLAARNRPKLLRGLNLGFIALIFLLGVFHYYQTVPLDFAFMWENARNLIYPAGLATMVTAVPLLNWAVSGVLAAGLVVVAWKTKWLANWPQPAWPRRTLLVTLAAYVAVLFLPAYTQGELAFMFKTGAWYVSEEVAIRRTSPVDSFPYFKPAQADLPLDKQNPHRPHVFIVMMESFNAGFVEARAPNGEQVTPVFNSLIKDGLYVERFYAPSPQTPRGQLATLASILPSYRRKAAVVYPNLRLRALPAIMAGRGYRTLFFQAYPDLKFDNTGPFMKKLGFQVRKAMNEEFVTPDDENRYVWGWGLQDNIFYRKFFDHLDRAEAEARSAGRDERYFATLATISHHACFSDTPPALRHFYPEPKSQHEQYLNSLWLADSFLREFFVELRSRPYLDNSIVVVMGDHGFPSGEHGHFANEADCYENNFRAPLLVLWPGHVAARRVRNVAYCQIDVAPTILDLLQIRAANHFIGRSILPGDDAPVVPIHQIQPYNGTYLGVVIGDLKYVQTLMGRLEFVYDLKADPAERNNLIDSYRGTETLQRMRGEIEKIRLNQRLMHHNRVWPD